MKKKLIPTIQTLRPHPVIFISNSLRYNTVILALLGSTFLNNANATMFEKDKLKIYGDFRARLEQDFDSQSSAGINRDDRLRARIRLRLGLNYKASDVLDLGVRLRSGSDNNQQSPHITVIDFDDNDTGDAHFNFDKWYLKAKHDGLWGWIGRNSVPFWKPNEFFWDDDVTPTGIGGGYEFKAGNNNKMGFNAGYFSLPAGMKQFCGNMSMGQAVLKNSGNKLDFTVAAGLYNFDKGNASDTDCGIYQQSNGARDYKIWVANFQGKVKNIAFGIDLMHNTEDYALTDPGINTANQNETDGWDIYATYGSAKNKGDWFFGYWYVYIEQFSVNNSFAGDDWVRWGSATQTRGSNMKGHELRAVYGMGDGMNLVTRLYLVESITSVEDGNRLRADLNIKF